MKNLHVYDKALESKKYKIDEQQKLRNLHLRKILLGEVFGPFTGKPSIDKKWLRYYSEEQIMAEMPEMTIYDYMMKNNQKNKNETALIYFGNKISFKQLEKAIDNCAKGMIKNGIKEDDIVTICMPNTPEAVIAFYALNKIGAVANMIHPLSSEKDIEYYLNKSNSKVMLCIDIAYKKVNNIIDNTSLEKVIVTSATKSMERITAFLYWLLKGRKINIKENEKIILWDHFIAKANLYNEDPYEQVASNDPAVILYSGGTTGKPKGVVISNYSFNAQALQSKYTEPEALEPENAFLTFLPNFHAFGIGICTHTPLYNGMRAILIPQFNAKKFKKYLRKYKFNVLCGVPTLYDAVSKMKFRKNELNILKLVVCGGDAMSIDLKKRVNAFLKEYGCKTELKIGYGLTESSGVVSLSPDGILDESDVIGYPFPNIEFKIIDINTQKETPLGEDGELIISGPNIMLEYLDEPEETKNTLLQMDGKTWLHTGDIACVDKRGLFHYKSRLKRMIITSGYNVYPSHVEEILTNHEAILKCAVIGIKNESKGETVKAFIVLREGYNNLLTKSSIQKYMKENLAKFEIPREIRYIEELPTTLVGKIAYKELEKMD